MSPHKTASGVVAAKFLDPALLVLYAIAATAGAIGGCGAAAWYMSRHGKPRAAMVAAYVILGLVFGVVTSVVIVFIGHEPGDVNTAALEAITGGAAGAIAIASANWSARVILRRLGIEIQVTMRRDSEERRGEDGEDYR